jgi:hypothetical protein
MTPAVVLLILRLLLALCLFAFFSLILISLWREMRGSPVTASLPPAAHLVVEQGPQPGRTFDLGVSNLLGRAPENAVSLRDATISAHHARLSFQGAQWLLEDLGSRNGTSVNAIPVESPLVVTYGDLLTVGSVSLRLVAGASGLLQAGRLDPNDSSPNAALAEPERQTQEPSGKGGQA